MAYLRQGAGGRDGGGGGFFQQAQHNQCSWRAYPHVPHRRPAAFSANAKAYSSSSSSQPFPNADFDMFEWYPHFQSCVRYFLDHAQYDMPVQAVAALINIRLPFQKTPHPVFSSRSAGSSPPVVAVGTGVGGPSAGPSSGRAPHHLGQLPQQVSHPPHVTVIPYLRRLVATGFDHRSVLHGFFGDSWLLGIGPLHELERRNYLFAAKSDNWLTVKATYDMGDDQACPFLAPLRDVTEKEIEGAEASWSDWLAMQDWMLGPRAPPPESEGGRSGGGSGGGPSGNGQYSGSGGHGHGHGRSVRIKHEHEEDMM